MRPYAYVRQNERKKKKKIVRKHRDARKEKEAGKLRVTERMRPARMRYIIAYTYIHIQFYVLSNPRGSEKNELNIGYPVRK